MPFSDLSSKIIDNRGKTCPTTDHGIALIATNCIKNENLYPVYENVRYVSEDTYKSWFRGHPEPGDLIFVTKGTPGQVCLVPLKVDFCIAQDMVSIRPNSNKVDPMYLFAALRSSEIQGEIENLHVGSLIPHFKKSDFDKLLIPLPKRGLQEYIGKQYYSFSSKIDLLHRQNKTLETMAETLWRKMFLEEADPNWKKGKLGDYVTVKGGTTPSTKRPEFWDGNNAWTSPRDLSNNKTLFLHDTERKITEKGLSQIGSGLLPKGTVLLSSRAPIGYLAISNIPVAINQGYIAVICDQIFPNYYMYFWIKINMDLIIGSANGSVFLEISKSVFKVLDIELPDKNIIDKFSTTINPIFEKILKNEIQIRTLSRLRDTLLPKLMSGEVRVKT
jgi:type I restriction enzyme S subunit